MNRTRFVIITLAVLVLVSSGFAQQSQQSVAGSWKCVATAGDTKSEFQLDLVQKGTNVSGTASRSDGSTDIQNGSFENGKLKLTINADDGDYVLEATLQGSSLKGTLTHTTGIKGTWEGTRAATPSAGVAGAWKVTATMGGSSQEYRLELKQESGKYSGALIMPQGDSIPLSKVSFEDNVLKFTVSAPDGDYSTESKFDGTVLKGTFTTPGGEKGNFQAAKI